jgi:hypothetical protein
MENEFEKFMNAEIKYINDAKWYEGIRTNKDPGNPFIESWAISDAKIFRDKWNKSCCKKCADCNLCGNNVRETCDKFKSA